MDYNVGDTFTDPREGQSVLWLTSYRLETDESDTEYSTTTTSTANGCSSIRDRSRSKGAQRYYRENPDYDLYEPRKDPFADM
jgi:hypothetical protein